jgi:acetyl-CoA C-acetyltransferase
MGNAAEWIADRFDVSREAQDGFALASHQKAVASINAGRFTEEITPVPVPQRRGDPVMFEIDECPRHDTSLEQLARLRPVFSRDGTITAGNASSITDGAAAVLISSAARADALGMRPMARITGYAYGATEPLKIFTAPVIAIHNLLSLTKTTLADYELIEINEAFAAQCLANGTELADEGWNWARVNVNGGAIALGHPIGCSGTRVLVTLLHALKQRTLTTGLAALCLGGGEAVAMSVEMMTT